MAKIKKGALVQLNSNICFTSENGGLRKYPISNYENDEKGIVEGFRMISTAEMTEWYESEESRGMDSAGESKLPPTFSTVQIQKSRPYTVLKARCVGNWGWRRHGGQTLILDTETGHEVYIKREYLEAV